MSKAAAFTATGGKKEAKVSLPKEVFGLEANHDLLSLSYNASLAAMREGGAQVLTRGEVRGGGKKPWRQKGTGRARVGSRRNPVWRGGGIVFGPTGNENFTITLNTKQKRLAIAQALSAKAATEGVVVIENLDVKSGKTADARKLLDKIGATGKLLIVTDKKSDKFDQATRNLAKVETVNATYLNVRNVLDADKVVFTKDALDKTAGWLLGKSKAESPKAEVEPKAAPKKTGVKK